MRNDHSPYCTPYSPCNYCMNFLDKGVVPTYQWWLKPSDYVEPYNGTSEKGKYVGCGLSNHCKEKGAVCCMDPSAGSVGSCCKLNRCPRSGKRWGAMPYLEADGHPCPNLFAQFPCDWKRYPWIGAPPGYRCDNRGNMGSIAVNNGLPFPYKPASCYSKLRDVT